MSRLAINAGAPESYQTVAALDEYVERSVDPIVLDLVRLRVSQLNGCEMCADQHTTDLETAGVSSRKLEAVSVWRTAGFFTEAERAALALTEQLTPTFEEFYERTEPDPIEVFSDRELLDLTLAIKTLNLWNRIGVSSHPVPGPMD